MKVDFVDGFNQSTGKERGEVKVCVPGEMVFPNTLVVWNRPGELRFLL